MQSLRRTLTDSGFEGVTSYYLDDISVSWADTATVSITRGDAVKMLFDHAHRWDEAVGPPPLRMWPGMLLTLRQLPGQSKTVIWAATVMVSLGRRI